MAETCIVCLGDLRTASSQDPPPPLALSDAATTKTTTTTTTTNTINTTNTDPSDACQHASSIRTEDVAQSKLPSKRSSPNKSGSLDDDEEVIAHLLPCRHDLHNACLKPWVERANSCPICRAVFNTVELTEFIGGPVLDSYPVRDKVQEAEIDPAMIIEDELFAIEAWEPCLVCGSADQTPEIMYCDICDKPVHVFCVGLDESSDEWYCRTCRPLYEGDLDAYGVPSRPSRSARRRTRSTARRRNPGRSNDMLWARVWQEVSRRLDMDLDFPYDEDLEQRTEEQRREFQQWERRLQVGSTQGATARLRDIATARVGPHVAMVAAPESQEEIRAWNAFNKAKESQDTLNATRRRKRRTTDSPASPQEPDSSEQPQLKRPRLRRPPPSMDHTGGDSANIAESSNTAHQRADDAYKNNTFLSSLLRDVENKPVSATSPTASDYPNGAFSPRNSSPARSPGSSGHATPRAVSVTPPPQRPMSPPLSSTIIPIHSPLPITFSPYSPTESKHRPGEVNGLLQRGRSRHRNRDHVDPVDRAGSQSPTDALSYSTKEELQRMVKAALGSLYRNKTISKDQYTDINRDVSRKLYELVGDASALTDQLEREKWQHVADAEVKKAIAALNTDDVAKEPS